ncbi:WD repeat-containing protein 44 [Nematostella vectensis]|uniref:WD repeat-containing protein 44 n=1 Tax=Nematostella vectensis TaxID=45351 RepID=UPI00207706F1|nr:WD repeat-containing protein 44 [Nematostella vectensis]
MASDSDSEGEFYDAPDSHCDSSFGTPKGDMNIESPVKELLLKTDSEVIKNKDLDRPSTHISDVIVPTSDSLEISCDTQSTQSDNAESNQDCGATSGGEKNSSYQAEPAPLTSPPADVPPVCLPVVSNTSLPNEPQSTEVVKNTVGDPPPPVAPPRRKRKKKSAGQVEDKVDGPAASTQQDPSQTVAAVLAAPSKESEGALGVAVALISNDTDKQTVLVAGAKCTDNGTIKTAVGSVIQPASSINNPADPSIQLDYKSQEMKEILAKASSTEVIPALTLDSRLKSHSVTSLGSSGNKSDSFMSLSSNASNGPIMRKSGSSASVGSIHSFQHGELVRVRSASGRPLSDIEILEQVLVKNLDTGESIPLSLAEERLPKGTNPLALHIMRLTSEYHSNSNLSTIDAEDGIEVGRKVKKKTKKLKKFLGRTVNKMKVEKKMKDMTIKEGKESVRSEESSSSDEDGASQETPSVPFIKIKSAHGKGPVEFEKLKLLQDLSGEHVGAVWTIKFSVCGRLMATAGQDHMVRVWVLKECQESFEEMRTKYSKPAGTSSQTNSEEDLEKTPKHDTEDAQEDGKTEDQASPSKKEEEEDTGPFMKKPFCTYCGHTGDVLDLSWSKNYFLLSSSMDKTVRLWHISRNECLCCFQHIDFVTAIVFHPRDDRYFLSGSLDGKIRLWNIPDKKVALWNEVEGTGSNLITAANFCLQGRFAVIGTYDGRCIFYETERLKYHTQWQVRSGRNKRSRGRKISGIEPMPGEEKVLITSNDSRIRLYDLKDNSLYCKYKGCSNSSSQIKASFSHDGQYLICGSEDHFVYIWRTQHGIPSSRRDKNEFYESFSAHDAVVTAAIFAPVPWLVVEPDQSGNPVSSEVLVTADWGGAIKLFVNR